MEKNRKNIRNKIIGIIGSRTLHHSFKPAVFSAVEFLLNQGYLIATGGAIGADLFAVECLLSLGAAEKSIVFSAWQNMSGFPKEILPLIHQLQAQGGQIICGSAHPGHSKEQIRNALLARNTNLVNHSHGLVAFINETSRGSIYTIKKAIQKKIPVVVFPINTNLPVIKGVNWLRSNKQHFESAFEAYYPPVSG